MDEIRDLLESDELRNISKAILALSKRRGEATAPNAAGSFKELALGKFQPRMVLDVLLDENAGYPGQKNVLAAGLSAWILFPKHRGIRLNWITQAILIEMDEAERAVGLVDEKWTLERDIVARYVLAGPAFLDDMYNTIGGYEAFTRINTYETLDAILGTEVKTVRTIARAMAYLQHGVHLHAKAKRYFKPSVNQTARIFDLLRIKERRARSELYVGRSLLHRRWREGHGTLALIYAADRIRVTKRKTLLDIMLDGLFSYSEFGHLLPTWLGMARYAAETIFTPMAEKNLLSSTMKILRDVEAVTIIPPTPTKLEVEALREIMGITLQ